MKKIVFIFILFVFVGAGVFWQRYFRGAGPALLPPPDDITDLVPPASPDQGELMEPPPSPSPNSKVPDAVNNTSMPLTLPAGFEISIFAKDVWNARDIVRDDAGNLWVSRTRDSKVVKLEVENGIVARQVEVFTGLKSPHGLAFDPHDPDILYIAEEGRISRARISSRVLEKIVDLPTGGNHHFFSLRFGSDGQLYVSLGSTCNVCREKDDRRGTIQRVNIAGGTLSEFADGLRNAPFMTFHPKSGTMWVTEMGRDFLGDDLPPDEINVVERGKNYGWPNCYGKNVHDTDFDKNVYVRNPCMEPFETPSHVDIPAHSAPLGLGFIPESTEWPREYWGDLIVAYHGSWNRTAPTGYKLVRMKLDANGTYHGTEDFVSGWLVSEGALGRPVGVLVEPNGTMYVTDDKAGVVYRIRYRG